MHGRKKITNETIDREKEDFKKELDTIDVLKYRCIFDHIRDKVRFEVRN
jgi:hypothetical protein